MIRLISLSLILVATTFAFSQTQPASQSSTNAAGIEHLKVKVTGVEGLVQVRAAEDQPWKKAEVGMDLDENAEFRTGPKSAVRFVIPPDQTVTLDRLGTVKVLQAISKDGKLTTNLGMKYGRTRYDIEEAGREHESTISSPSSTLAVRGTKVSLYDQRPFTPQAVSLTGRAQFRDAKKRAAFGGKGAGKTTINTEHSSAAELLASEAFVDPNLALAHTSSEEDLLAALVARGAVVSFDNTAGIRVVRGGRPLTDKELIPTLPGQLDFVLRWTGNADLNLSVGNNSTTAGEFIYPVGGLDVSASGGRTAFDHRGGANGGMEIVFWPAGFPSGLYGIGVTHISGAPAVATIDAFQDGKRIGITNFTSPGLVDTITTPIDGQVIKTAAAIAPVNTTLPGFSPPPDSVSQVRTSASHSARR